MAQSRPTSTAPRTSLLSDRFTIDDNQWVVSMVHTTSANEGLCDAIGVSITRLLIEGKSRSDGHPSVHEFYLRKESYGTAELDIEYRTGLPGKDFKTPASYYYYSFAIPAPHANALIDVLLRDKEAKALKDTGPDDYFDETKEKLKAKKSARKEFEFLKLTDSQRHVEFKPSAFNWVREQIISILPTAAAVIPKTIDSFLRDGFYGPAAPTTPTPSM